MVAIPPQMPDSAWQVQLDRARTIAAHKADLIPAPETLTARETLPAAQQAPLKRAVLVVPAKSEPGVAMAIADLTRYLQAVTGKPVTTVVAGMPMPADAAGATVIAIGQGAPSGKPEGYAIRATGNTIRIAGDDLRGMQYGIYRLMELSGKRFYSYEDQYTPAVGQAVVPTNGFTEVQAPTAQMKTRGFSPHTYHPIPLSEAFHNPSPEHLAMIKRYIDWQVQNGQNFIMFPFLELDQKNGMLPIVGSGKKYEAWVPYAREIMAYAKARGVRISIKVAFANYVSSNVFAINPLKATYQSIRIDSAAKKVAEYEKPLKDAKARLALADAKLAAAAPGDRDRVRAERDGLARSVAVYQAKYTAASKTHQQLLSAYGNVDAALIRKLVDKLMEVPWDDIAWNMGTSEFTPTNDDLTIRWLNEAARYVKAKYPQVTTTARSHVPSRPWSEKYDTSYFDLIRFSDPAMGQLIHTTEAYGLTDKAPVYGNQDFTHKLKQLTQATPERNDIYYPETSYWVAHDVSVPLFLPVYMLNRKSDLEVVKGLPNLDGQVGFTTGWEWGYWLNDYILARMQSHPEESLTQMLDGAFAPLGAARTPMVRLMNEAMYAQQKYLLDGNLIRHMQGFDSLTDFGVKLQELPVVNKFIEGTNSTPVRLRADQIMKWDLDQLSAFEKGDLAQMGKMAREFEAFADRADALRASVSPGGEKYQDELADGLRVNARRARQVLATLSAEVYARKYALTKSPVYKQQAEAQMAAAQRETDAAMALIHDREKDYRGNPQENYGTGDSLTLWPDHYLTPVHTGKYWTNTLGEAQKAVAKAVGR